MGSPSIPLPLRAEQAHMTCLLRKGSWRAQDGCRRGWSAPEQHLGAGEGGRPGRWAGRSGAASAADQGCCLEALLKTEGRLAAAGGSARHIKAAGGQEAPGRS